LAVSAWLGAGATAVGIGAALIGGAATAAAQPGDSTHHSAGRASDHRNSATATAKQRATAPDRRAAPANNKKKNRAATPGRATTTPRHAVANAATDTDERASTAVTTATATATATATKHAPTNISAISRPKPSADLVQAPTTQATASTKTRRHEAAVIARATPSDASRHSAPLAALATASQLASAPIENKVPAAAAAQATTSKDWLGGNLATPGASVTLALQEIGQAQKIVGNNLLPQMFLAVAKWALGTWQQTNAAAIANYARNSAGPAGFVAKMVLDFNESLPGLARTALQTAQTLTSSSSTAHALIKQASMDGRVYGSVKLSMYNGTEPIVEISINGGPKVKVLVDTGSSGLVVTGSSVGTAAGLGPKIGTGTSGYSGGLTYGFDIYNTTVDFGNGITTTPTAVDIVNGTSQAAYLKYMAANGVVGVLGIGANSAGPGPSLITSALPGELKNGIFIDEAAGKLQFGPNPRPVRASVSGSPSTPGMVKVLGVSYPINLVIDSGGVYGTIPSTVWTAVGETQVPGGIPIEVYSADGSTLLYSYTTTNTNTPLITFDAAHAQQMNTGYTPFHLGPVYISYTTPGGETNFDL